MLTAFSGASNPGVSFSPTLPTAVADLADPMVFDVQRDLLDPISAASFEALDHILAPDCLLLLPGLRPVTGAALTKRVLRAIRRRYDALVFETVLQFRSADDLIVANSKVQGVCDGLPYANELISLIRLDRFGRVALVSDYLKDTASPDQVRRRPLQRHV